MNNVNLVGRVVKDIEVLQTKQGKAVTSFDVAIDNGKDVNGEKRQATFIRIVAFDKTATLVGKFVKKGDLLGVTGSLAQRSYIAKDGSTRYVVEVIASSVDFLQPKVKTESPKTKQGEFVEVAEVDDNLPF